MAKKYKSIKGAVSQVKGEKIQFVYTSVIFYSMTTYNFITPFIFRIITMFRDNSNKFNRLQKKYR